MPSFDCLCPRRFTPTSVGNTPAQGLGHDSLTGSPPQAWGTPCKVTPSSAATSVHPHKREEHPLANEPRVTDHGSPPQAWGTPVAGESRSRSLRFTPTSVGNTDNLFLDSVFIPVHPHKRGEHLRHGHARQDAPPVHPHKRGEHGTPVLPVRWWRRFTPTSVGNTACCRRRSRPRPVHPHKRGEHERRVRAPRPVQRFTPTSVGNTTPCGAEESGRNGSPPQAWGTRRCPRRRTSPRRFTPTSVGNTPARGVTPRSPLVHPHKRGEHRRPQEQEAADRGSPPQAWGTRLGAICRYRRPAGSPPQAWGTRPLVDERDLPRRFTPTSVGNTDAFDIGRGVHSVHPHKRGEHGAMKAGDRFVRGSPPQAWGTRVRSPW